MERSLILLVLMLSAGIAPAMAQIVATFNVSHMGLQPSDEATVNVGDTVQFIYGGGGPHPMTSGHNQTESPVFFPTVTVTSAVPEAFCALEEPGTYYFHCATNPMNSNNWGTLNVVDPNNPTDVTEVHDAPAWGVVNDVLSGQLKLSGSIPAHLFVFNAAGQCVMEFQPNGQTAIPTESWATGLYFVTGTDGVKHAVFIGS